MHFVPPQGPLLFHRYCWTREVSLGGTLCVPSSGVPGAEKQPYTASCWGRHHPTSQNLDESAPHHVQPSPTSPLEEARRSNPYVECTSHNPTTPPLLVACHLLHNSGKMAFRDFRTVSMGFCRALCSPSSGQILRQLVNTTGSITRDKHALVDAYSPTWLLGPVPPISSLPPSLPPQQTLLQRAL